MEVNLHFGHKYPGFARWLHYLHDSEIDVMKTSVARNGIPDNRRYRTRKSNVSLEGKCALITCPYDVSLSLHCEFYITHA